MSETKPRPEQVFFADPAIDRMMGVVMALAGEVYVLRDRVRAHASVSMVDASAVAEGPLGSGKHGSWLVAARKSYLDLVIKRLYADQNLSFGFTDVQSKLAWHVSDSHQITLSMTGGRSKLDLVPNAVSNPNDLRDAVSTQPADSPIKWVLNARAAIAQATGETDA